MAVHLAVAGDVLDGVFFVLSFFRRDVMDGIWTKKRSVNQKQKKKKKEKKRNLVYPSNLKYGPYHIGAVL